MESNIINDKNNILDKKSEDIDFKNKKKLYSIISAILTRENKEC